MKKALLRWVLLVQFAFCSLASFAQAPQAIPFQAVARDNNGNPITNQQVELRFSILDSVINGPVVYQETHSTTTNSLGLFTVYICQGTTTGTFDPIKWEKLNKFVKIEIDTEGNGVFTDMGTQQLLSVPYALYAEKSGSSLGSVIYKGTWDAVTNSPPLLSATGTKGFYYVVTNASANPNDNTTLSGINDWGVGDWAIHNGTAWEKVDNSESITSALGSVVYVGTWDASTNDRSLSSSTGTKGNYYVVSVAGNTDLDGITDWQIGDWAIFNGTKWEKVNNYDEDIPTIAEAIMYAPNANITSTNVQDAIEEVYGAKVNRSGDTMTGDLVLNADPSSALGAATKQYVDNVNTSLQTQVNAKVNKAGDTMTGYLILNADPTSALGAVTKQYVDAGDAAFQTQVNAKVDRAGDTMTGYLVLNADPSGALGAATKQYVDAQLNDGIVSSSRTWSSQKINDELNAKLDLTGGTMTGDLVLNADPTTALGAATKKYVDDHSSVVPNGDQVGQILYWNGTAWVKSSEIFTDGKKFGVGSTTRVGYASLDVSDDPTTFRALAIRSSDPGNNVNWFFGRTSLNPDSAGLNIEEESPLGAKSRLFIKESTGYVGIGTLQPEQKLHLQSSLAEDRDFLGLKLYNEAAQYNRGWNLGHVHDNAVTTRDGAFSIIENTLTDHLERITILPGGNVGINEQHPDVKLHVSRPASDPQEPINLAEGTGIAVFGPIDDKNLAFDSRQIQARHGEYVASSSTLSFTASELGLQPLGGNILIHGSSTNNDKVIITNGGNVGVNELTPDVKLHVTRPVSDPNVAVDLIEGTGIMVLGPMTDNVVFDYRGMQARTGSYTTSGLQLSASSLNLQRLGGDVLIHGDNTIPDERKFIIKDDGKVGIGTVTPLEKLHIEGSASDGIVGLKILNTATTANQGWIIGQENNNTVSGRNGALNIKFSSGIPTTASDGLRILTNGNVGVNELLPDVKLHVSRPVSDPLSEINLVEGTGIVVIGPMTDNVVFDYKGIQARTGSYISTGLQLSASSLNLQKLGGDILIHGESTFSDERKFIIKDDGKVGLGTLSPQEKIDIDGAIKIGTTVSSNDGTIRYTGTDFEGRKGGSWVSLTAGNGPWTIGVSGIYYDATNPKVGIGIATPTSALQVDEHSNVTADNKAASISNSSTTSSSSASDNRVGLHIQNTGTWSSNTSAKDIGLYVKEVSGQSSSNANLAAVINGNVVIGNVTSADMVGSNGSNVLAIQNGAEPSSLVTSSGLPDGGIQIYSGNDATGVSTFHVKNGDGTVIKLYRESALQAPDNTTISTSTYGSSEAAVINNLRTRINELESKLQALGLLE